jgi:hypothetical protein
MCGGAGARLGPISRNSLSKQLGERSTFQDTVLRLRHKLFKRPILLTNRDHRGLAEKQLAKIDAEADIVMEPERLENGGIEPLELIVVQNRSDPPARRNSYSKWRRCWSHSRSLNGWTRPAPHRRPACPRFDTGLSPGIGWPRTKAAPNS